jgi:hypothetical protein
LPFELGKIRKSRPTPNRSTTFDVTPRCPTPLRLAARAVRAILGAAATDDGLPPLLSIVAGGRPSPSTSWIKSRQMNPSWINSRHGNQQATEGRTNLKTQRLPSWCGVDGGRRDFSSVHHGGGRRNVDGGCRDFSSSALRPARLLSFGADLIGMSLTRGFYRAKGLLVAREREVKSPGERGRRASGGPTRDGKWSSARKYARVQPNNANSPNYAKSFAKLLDHVFYVLSKQTRIASAFTKLLEMLGGSVWWRHRSTMTKSS